MSQHLFGVHDWSPDWGALIRNAGMTAWAVISESIGDDPNDRSGHDYSALAAFGVTPIVRLNYSHHGQGTIPLPNRYDAFAQRCANFVSASPGCRHWIIANETNWSVERPGGVAITPRQYANCFYKCQRAIKYRSAHHHVIVAAVAPYNVETGPWLDYWHQVLVAVAGDSGADGLALHFYSRGADPASIRSDTKMDAPFGHLYNGFRAYRDLLAMVPDDLRHLPAYATETNQLQPWADTNSGWVQAAYAEINEWNADPSHQPIKCLALYRWETYDQFGLKGKNGVIADFQAAIGRGYQSPPILGASTNMEQTFIPTLPNKSPAAPALPPIEWDARLDARGVAIMHPQVALQPGQTFWRVTKAQWFDQQQSGGRHHIYVEAPAGTPFGVTWPSGSAPGRANGKGGFDAGNFNMSPSLKEFSVAIDDGKPSETVTGIGMGADGNPGIHTSTLVRFETVTMPIGETVTQPPIVSTGPQPVPAPSVPSGNEWQRCIAFVRKWEGGWADHPSDPGGATNKGITIGTYTRWRAAHSQPAPTKDDLRNITDAEVNQIYFEWYWKASGSDKLAWPLCLAHFDTAVNAGPGRAAEMLQKSNGNFFAYMGHLIDWYTRIQNFEHFGRAWIRRRAEILLEASKP